MTITYQEQDINIYSNEYRLKKVIVNLLINAINYSHDSKAIIVSSKQLSDRIEISVQDSGVGIEEKDHDRVFESFTRLDHGLDKQINGSGIGLTLCKHLMEQMHGSIGFTSVKNQGSVFYLHLPVVSTPSKIEAIQKEVQLPQETEVTVLYIEDHLPSRQLLQLYFTRYPNVRLLTANNSEEAFEIVKVTIPSIIFIDINLPGVDGLEVLKTFKENSALNQSRMVALSADAMPEQIRLAMQQGFDEYLTKPVDIDCIVKEVELSCHCQLKAMLPENK